MAAVAVACLALAACGFRPVHAPGPDGAAPPTAQVRVQPIPDRLGQILHTALEQQLTPGGAPRQPAYVLQVGLSERVGETGFREDETATRRNIRLEARYTLVAAESGQVLLRGAARSTNSANVLDAPYATVVSERDARRRGAQDLADQIARDIASRLAVD